MDKNVVVGPKGELHPYWGMGLHSPDVNWSLGTPERMKKLAGLIEEAKKLTRTPEEKIRLQRFIDGIWTNAKHRTKGDGLLPAGLLTETELRINNEEL